MFVVAARDTNLAGQLWGMPTAIAIRVVNINEGARVQRSRDFWYGNDGHIVRYVGFNTPAGQDIGDPIVATGPGGADRDFHQGWR